MEYQEKKFELPVLEGISKESIDAHLGLYAGYVKNFNAINAAIASYLQDSATNAHAISELMRRKSFEFGGMRLHELYFSQWEGAATPPISSGALATALNAQFGSVETAITHVKQCGMMRGPGWSILYFDPLAGAFHVGFSEQQHQGHFVTLPVIVALDVWEHAYLKDYGVAGKDKYIDAFFKNFNWSVAEARFGKAAART